MEPFVRLDAVAAPLLTANVNTDVLVRVEAMINVPKGKLGPHCFEIWRYLPDGSDNHDFVLNQPAYRAAKILLAGVNFGCGSSREPAVWALWDMGYRCIIAPSFGDIFFNNCFQSGMLPIVLPAQTIATFAEEAKIVDGAAPNFIVDLEQQIIIAPSGAQTTFNVDELKRHALTEGLDDIGVTLAIEDRIASFQNADRQIRPWVYNI